MPRFKMLNDFLIGCDPEFAGVTETGGLVNFVNRLPHEGTVGYDHNGWVGEIRPEPSHGTYMLLKKLQKNILELPQFRGVKKLRGGAYVTGSMEQEDGRQRAHIAIGGHIHLDISPYGNRTENVYTEAHKYRIQALDSFTKYLEALDILPKTESNARRASSGYGKYGDVRVQGQPGAYRTEYRTMASWLFHPIVAMICLTGAKLSVIDPAGTHADLLHPSQATFKTLVSWFERYKSKDTNAKRVCEKLLTKEHKDLVLPPDDDFREKWRDLQC